MLHVAEKILSMLVVITMALPFASLQAQPKIEVIGGTRIDFDTLYAGDIQTREVRIRNNGPDTLVIHHITASCDCARVRVNFSSIAPNHVDTVFVTFDSEDYAGRVAKHININSNATNANTVVLGLTATVLRLLEFEPHYVSFSRRDWQSGRRKRILVRNTSTDSITVVSISDPAFLLDTEFPPTTIPPGAGAELLVSAKAIGERSRYGKLTIRTDNARQPVLKLPYYIQGKKQ